MKKLDPKPPVTSLAGPRPAPVRHRELLLYVEDNDDNWRVVDMRLSENYEILRATNARDACRVLQQRGPELAAILMDIELRSSDLNGLQLTELIRGKRPRIGLPDYAQQTPQLSTPIIFVTAHGTKYTDTHLMLLGGDKVIAKPVDFAALSLALTQLHLSSAALKRRRPLP